MVKFFHVVLLSIAFQSSANALDGAEQNRMVEMHNKYRAQVGVPGVVWSGKLASIAQAYANKLSDELACRLIHSHTRGLGENLFWASEISYSNGKTEVQDITSREVADSWGSERAHYFYANNSCARGEVCGHYTQMVWANTSEIGCAKAICGNGAQVWVCNYAPAGNYIGERPY